MHEKTHSEVIYAPSAPTDESGVLLQFERLHKVFGAQIVLNGVSGKIRSGEVILLRGENGAGKTTLIDILTGNLEPDSGAVQLTANGRKEDFRFPRYWLSKVLPFSHFVPERVANEGVGRTWQEIRLFSTQDLLSNIAVGKPKQVGENPVWAILRPRAVQTQEQEVLSAVKHVLGELGLEGREHSSADMVSLGQAKRVAIARAIQAGAKILFLDEPLAGLDTKGIADVMNLLGQLAHQQKLAVVIVEHALNIPHILDLASTVWTLDDGQLVLETPSTARELLRRRVPAGYLRHISSASGKVHENLFRNEIPGGASLISKDATDGDGRPPSLEVRDLVVYRGKRLVIGERTANGQILGLSFRVHKGRRAYLLAPNGWGKTTLLMSLAGLIPIAGGTVLVNGIQVQNLPSWERVRVGLCFAQARCASFPRLRVHEVFRLVGQRDCPDSIERLWNRRVSQLSGGERQLVSLLSALHGQSAIALLDEPHLALDYAAQNELDCILDALRGAVLIAEPRTLTLHKEETL